MKQFLCGICREIDLREYFFQELCPATITLGGYQDIAKKKNCALCRIIIKALSVNSASYWEDGIYPSEICYFGREDGHSRPLVEVWYHATSDTCPKGVSGHSTMRGEILLAENNNIASIRRKTNLGRQIDLQIEVSQLREWLKQCEANHGECNNLRSREASKSTNYLILIDVKRRKLVECNTNYRYVALSYVWGRVSTFQTLKENFHQLCEDGSLTRVWTEISQTIRDAIVVVSCLGETYLWVDALCLLQDSAHKTIAISCMDVIYGNAILTIVASAGLDANARLPGLRPLSRTNNQSSEVIGQLCLMNKLPELRRLIEMSKWESRAWTFQEKVLSRRCLFFTESQVYFQCHSGICREDIVGEYYENNPSMNVFDVNVSSINMSRDVFRPFECSVMPYSHRELSYRSDVLDGFSGIISAFKKHHGWNFLSALPEDFFHLALLWRPMISCEPRIASADESVSRPPTVFPSWCWTSQIGDIYWNRWRTDSYAGSSIQIRSEIGTFAVQDRNSVRILQIKHGNADIGHPASSPVPFHAVTNVSAVNEDSLLHEDNLHKGQVLYFWAEAVPLDTSLIHFGEPFVKGNEGCILPNLKGDQHNQAWLYDSAGRHCGTLEGVRTWPHGTLFETGTCEFLLLSRSYQKILTEAHINANLRHLPLEYLLAQEYYDKIFDVCHYPLTEDWALNVMLVQWRGPYAERLAVGQIHSEAWANQVLRGSLCD